ncbi:MAG: hypothetical protein KatS3mg109_0246 [Pirellulaceae bacterium]|nr:MAG: hypothetical protein KatS3mg109_0246 [Pirellulaceae bacterium]
MEQASQMGPRVTGHHFGHQRSPYRPFAPDAHRHQETQYPDLPQLGGKVSKPGKHRIKKNRQRHGGVAAYAIGQPSKSDSPDGSPDQKNTEKIFAPLSYLRVVLADPQQFGQHLIALHIEQLSFESVEHPTGRSNDNHGPLIPGDAFVPSQFRGLHGSICRCGNYSTVR